MMRFLVLLLLGAGACAKPAPALAPTFPVERHVEAAPLPPDPETEPLEGDIPDEDWVEPLEEGSCLDARGKPLEGAPKPCPERSGISMAEAKAARLALYKVRHRQLRTDYEADRKVWAAQREAYQVQLGLADKAIRDLQPSWWERHDGQLGILGGLVLGTAACVAIFSIAN